ncbi:MAG: mycarose O-acyltransferase [Blastococcus sp.]|nr:mycarose O-acyltransferase [Blastococcus sp.]
MRLHSLTGLRFLAAFMVFMSHCFPLGTGTFRQALLGVFGQGRAGVSFFFILSGFVLAWSMTPGDNARSFWGRRLARLWPAYAVAAVAGYLVGRWVDHRYFSLEGLARNLVMIQSWTPAKSVYFSINSVNWSLSAEAFFYLTFPLYARPILNLTARKAAVLGGVLFTAIWAVGVPFVDKIPLGGGFVLPDNTAIWLVYVCPAVRVLEFMLGIVLVALVRRAALPRVPAAVAWVSAAVAWGAASVLPVSFGAVAVTVLPFCLLIISYSQTDVVAPRSTLWSSRTLVWLGNVSFCFYLVHQLVLRVFTTKAGTSWLAVGGGMRTLKSIAFVFVVSLTTAWLLHVLVEKPCERVLRGLRSPGRATRPLPPDDRREAESRDRGVRVPSLTPLPRQAMRDVQPAARSSSRAPRP